LGSSLLAARFIAIMLLEFVELEAVLVKNFRHFRHLKRQAPVNAYGAEAVSESESQLHMPTEPAVTLGTLDAEGHLLVSTGYWQIGHSKRGDREQGRHVYERCMPPVMSLNAPMALYGDAAGLEAMRAARQNSGGPLSAAASKEVDVQQLGPCGEAPEALASRGGEAGVTNDGDVPSQELGCIWDGKPRLLARSARDHPGFAWYAWLDVCMGHGEVPFEHGAGPWPSTSALAKLPSDRIAVSFSGQHACEDCREGWTYCHCVAGTAFVVPAVLVEPLAQNFSRTVRECLSMAPQAFVCLSDQVILTKLLLREPERFYIASQGYGAVATQYLTDLS